MLRPVRRAETTKVPRDAIAMVGYLHGFGHYKADDWGMELR